MDTAEMVQRLSRHLQLQMKLFESMDQIQTDLLRKLNGTGGMPDVMDLLEKKNAMLDEVRHNNVLAAPVLKEWNQTKSTLGDSPEIIEIDGMLDRLEDLARVMKRQDEDMVARFQRVAQPVDNPQTRQKHSQNMLNAFRALR